MIKKIRQLFGDALCVSVAHGDDELGALFAKLLEPQVTVAEEASRVAGCRRVVGRALMNDRIELGDCMSGERCLAEARGGSSVAGWTVGSYAREHAGPGDVSEHHRDVLFVLDNSGSMDAEAARRTRSIIMFLGPLLHRADKFTLPYAGGCDLGTRTIEPHMIALRRFGLEIAATDGLYHAQVDHSAKPGRPIVLTERGDTVTENALLAAARHGGTTVIRNASSNYMVQDLCFFLEALGVQIEGVGTTTLTVHGVPQIDVDVDYSPSEDPVEAMSLLAAAVVTESELTIRRVPIEFLEIELAVLEEMGVDCDRTPEYPADNGRTRLVDLTVRPSKLEAPIDKIHPMPFPGLNIDNVPFFAAIAASAHGKTLIHDWVYDNRAIYLTDLNRLGGRLQLLDPHRVLVEGPTRWRAAEMMCPPALRPAVVVLLAMMAAEGTSVLRNVYVINRGYEDLAQRLNSVGAQIEIFRDI